MSYIKLSLIIMRTLHSKNFQKMQEYCDTFYNQYFAKNYFSWHHRQYLIWLGYWVINPFKSRNKVLQELHNNHPGMVRMKKLASSFVWCSAIDRCIEDTVKSILPNFPENASCCTSTSLERCCITMVKSTFRFRD